MVKVSVILPVYNPGNGLERCIESLQHQTLKDIEIIFVDDRGADDAIDKIRAAAKKDARMKILVNPRNLGAGPSRNRGLEVAEGEYLSFVDSDDYLANDFLELLYMKAKETDADIVKGELVLIDPKQGFKKGVNISENWSIVYNSEHGKPIYTVFAYQHTTAIYHRHYIIEHNVKYGYASNAEDGTFLLRACYPVKRIEVVDGAYYYYVKRENSSVRQFSKKRLVDELCEYKTKVEYITEHHTEDIYESQYISTLLQNQLSIYYAVLLREKEYKKEATKYFESIIHVLNDSPYADEWAKEDVIINALYRDGIGLILSPYGGHWGGVPYSEYEDCVVQWVEYICNHPDLSEKGQGYLWSVFTNALQYIGWENAGEKKAAYRRLRQLANKLPDRNVLTKEYVAMKLFVDYGINMFSLRNTGFGVGIRGLLKKLRDIKKGGVINTLIAKGIDKFPLWNLIVFESWPDVAGNTGEVFREMIRRGWNKKYRFVWWLQSSKADQHEKIRNVYYLQDSWKRKIAIRMAKMIITENNYLYVKREEQYHLHMLHGAPLKRVTGHYHMPDHVNVVISLSPYLIREDAINNGSRVEMLRPMGFPRNDVLLRKRNPLNKVFSNHSFTKLIYWLPTYRQYKDGSLITSDISIPIIHDEVLAEQVNQAAKEHNVLIVVKPHFGQDVSRIKKLDLSNLIFIDEAFLTEHKIVNYSLLRDADAMLSDYSSVYYDYLMVDRPIGLCWEDFDVYRSREGFIVDPDFIMQGGEKLYTANDLCGFIERVAAGEDVLCSKRREIRDLLFPDGVKPCTAEITDYIGTILDKL